MHVVRNLVLALAACAAPVLAQDAPRMYPGTDFPGNDLYAMPAASPEDCAARCVADGRCKAFTFAIPQRQCQVKWAVSRFDGSLAAVSGVVESRPVAPPGSAGAGSTVPPVVVVPAGPPPSCSAPGNVACGGCSIACAPGQQASCTEGQVTGSTSPVCWTQAKCECRGAGAPPPSVYTPGPGGAPNANACTQPDRFACRGCSAACPADEKPLCSPAIPGENNTCRLQAFCRCVRE